jgi:hypothetical protein
MQMLEAQSRTRRRSGARRRRRLRLPEEKAQERIDELEKKK